MDLGLEDRVALITGSSRGIGKATAVLFGKEGARVAATYHDQRERAEAVLEEIKSAGGEALAVASILAASNPSTRLRARSSIAGATSTSS